MAKETVSNFSRDVLSDKQTEAVLQVDALLCMLRRNLGGEAGPQGRIQDEDVFRTLMVAQQFLEAALDGNTPVDNAAPRVGLMFDALAVIRGLTCAAFVAAKDSPLGRIQLEVDDISALNAIWAASRLILEARGDAR